MKSWLKQHANGGKAIYEGPLVFSRATLAMDENTRNATETKERYYLWLFGPVYQLPFERSYTDVIGPGNSLNDIAEKRLLKQ